jgi:hypothetical protein
LSRTIIISLEDRNGYKGSQVLRVFDTCTSDLGEPAKEMSTRGWELVAADESAIVPKPSLDPVVVKNGQGDGGLPNSPSADQSNRGEALGEIDDLLDQFVASEEGPWRERWEFSRYAGFEYEIMYPTVVQTANLS